MTAAAAAAGNGKSHRAVHMDNLMNDPDLEKLHKDRLMEMQREAEKRAVMQRKGHGEYQVRGMGRGTAISAQAPAPDLTHYLAIRCQSQMEHIKVYRVQCGCLSFGWGLALRAALACLAHSSKGCGAAGLMQLHYAAAPPHSNTMRSIMGGVAWITGPKHCPRRALRIRLSCMSDLIRSIV